jgi:hypothetical protein
MVGIRIRIRIKVYPQHFLSGPTEIPLASNEYLLSRTGSVGFISVLFPFLFPLGLIVVDEETRSQVT